VIPHAPCIGQETQQELVDETAAGFMQMQKGEALCNDHCPGSPVLEVEVPKHRIDDPATITVTA
jgi:hypothetical protein